MTDKKRAALQAVLEMFEHMEGRPHVRGKDDCYEDIIEEIRAALAEQDAEPPYLFARYINGRLMAEGVVIERETTLAGAAAAAARLASRGPNDEAPVLVISRRAALAEQAPCDMGDICIGCTPRRSDGGCPGEQKPAAWIRDDTAITTDAYQAACWRDSHTVTPLYAGPTRRKWVGLTNDERQKILDTTHPDNRWTLAERVEYRLKERNK